MGEEGDISDSFKKLISLPSTRGIILLVCLVFRGAGLVSNNISGAGFSFLEAGGPETSLHTLG